MAKLFLLVVLVAFVAVATAASFGGVKDWAGNYYDFTTGQYASALTGKVYDTVAPVAPVYTAPLAAAPYYYGYPYHYGLK